MRSLHAVDDPAADSVAIVVGFAYNAPLSAPLVWRLQLKVIREFADLLTYVYKSWLDTRRKITRPPYSPLNIHDNVKSRGLCHVVQC